MRLPAIPAAVVLLAAAGLGLLAISPEPGYGSNSNDYTLGYQQGSQAGAANETNAAVNQTKGTASPPASDSSSKSGCS